jgi:hypothetical protein
MIKALDEFAIARTKLAHGLTNADIRELREHDWVRLVAFALPSAAMFGPSRPPADRWRALRACMVQVGAAAILAIEAADAHVAGTYKRSV